MLLPLLLLSCVHTGRTMSAEHFLCGVELLLCGWCGRLDRRSWSDGGASFLCFTVCVENCVMSCQQLWDREKILTLIKLYEQHSLLWNPREENYKMKNKRNDSLKVIATEIGADVEVVKKKIDSLLSQYRREKKIAESKSGMGSDEKKTHWWVLKHFAFLNDKFTPRPTYSSLQPQQEVIENSYQQEDMIEDEEKVGEGSTRDALSIYGENIASRLKNICNRRRQLILMNKIDNLLFEAEIEEEDGILFYSALVDSTSDSPLWPDHPCKPDQSLAEAAPDLFLRFIQIYKLTACLGISRCDKKRLSTDH
ncbi:hypothetical protein J6590_003489 [Homalodisca vitripennis]|nr:hypothetical protein J6590_003489 [Homalodisca vitripennis]